MRKLTAELDEIAWGAQAQAEKGTLPQHAYYEAFARARASAAVGFALEPDAPESVYEAWHAIADPEAVRMAVTSAMD